MTWSYHDRRPAPPFFHESRMAAEALAEEQRREAIVRRGLKRPLRRAGIPFQATDSTETLYILNEMAHRAGRI